jgi:hypothetical protein
MQTVTDQLREMAEVIKAEAKTLLRKYSYIKHCPHEPSSILVVFGPDHYWKPLDEPGQQLQSKVRTDYDKFFAILSTLLKSQTISIKSSLAEHDSTVKEVINQHEATELTTIDEAFADLTEAINSQVALLSSLHDAADGEHIYVPDTNALLYNPALEDWEFDVSRNFIVIITPTVLSELDQLKVNHRNENVRQKAEGLIRRLKGYRSRGRLVDGVPLRKGNSTLMTIATEPKMEESLPWLQANNNDDRILAGLIEVMREHPRCQVILVTRDMNLQNKTEFAGLPFVEPPEPIKTTGTT